VAEYRHSIKGHNSKLLKYIESDRGYKNILYTSNKAIDYLKSVNGRHGWHANTGAVCIIEILQYEPKEVFMTGFSFFKGYKVYSKGYRDCLSIGKHEPDRDINLVKDAIKLFGREKVIMDNVMQPIVYKKLDTLVIKL
jgi:hypothetical protein